MLYLSTRGGDATYPPEAVLTQDRPPDGGLFVPQCLPELDRSQIGRFLSMEPEDCIAGMMNLLLHLDLTGQQVADSMGMDPRIVPLQHKMAVAEFWCGKDKTLASPIGRLLLVAGCRAFQDASWPRLAAEISVLFAMVGKLRQSGGEAFSGTISLAVSGGDFTIPAAAWYAKQMGLPLDVVVCCCNQNMAPWDLIHKGEMRMAAAPVHTNTPRMDVPIPDQLERILHQAFGPEAAASFASAAQKRGIFRLEEDQADLLQKTLWVSVVGSDRTAESIARVYRTADYLMSPYTALAYNGLMDHRALKRRLRPALIVAEESPTVYAGQVLEAMGLPGENRTAQLERLQEMAEFRREARR